MPVFRPIYRAIHRADYRALTAPSTGAPDPHAAAMASFAGGVQGFAFHLTDATKLYQDTARTIPVTTAGHKIASAFDLSGHGFHAVQATGANQPEYQGAAQFIAGTAHLVTPSVDFTGTNKVTVVIKMAHESNAANSIPFEMSAISSSNAGSFAIFGPNSTANSLDFYLRGTSAAVVRTAPGQVAPVTNTIILELDLSAGTVATQLGVEIVPSGGSTSTGGSAVAGTTFGNYAFYIGRRGGTTLPYKGKILAIGVIGKILTTAEKNIWRDWANTSFAPALHGAIANKVVVAKRGDDFYVRTVWAPGVDLCQRVAMANGRSEVPYMMNLMGARLIANSAIDARAAYNLATGANNIADQSDDMAPAYYHSTYVGANHGCDRLYRFPRTAHGKTVEDIGSVWTDAGGNRWVLFNIVDANTLEIISENQSVYPAWSFRTWSGTTLTHAQDATHTSSMTATGAVTQYQLYPAVNLATKAVLLNGTTDILNANDAVYTGDWDGFGHIYNVMNPAAIVNFCRARVGSSVAPNYADPSIAGDLQFVMDYQFNPYHGAGVPHSAEALRNLPLGYLGFMQAVKINETGTNTRWTHIPRVNPITVGANTYDFEAQHNMAVNPDPVFVGTANWKEPANPPSSMTQIVKNSGGTKQFAFSMGYLPDKGIAVPATRIVYTDESNLVAGTTGKHRITATTGTAPAYSGGVMPQGAKPSVFGYRAFANLAQDFPHGPEFSIVRDGSAWVVFMSFDTTLSNQLITLPSPFAGMTVTAYPNETTASVTLHSATVSGGGITVSSSGTYGRLAVRLT